MDFLFDYLSEFRRNFKQKGPFFPVQLELPALLFEVFGEHREKAFFGSVAFGLVRLFINIPHESVARRHIVAVTYVLLGRKKAQSGLTHRGLTRSVVQEIEALSVCESSQQTHVFEHPGALEVHRKRRFAMGLGQRAQGLEGVGLVIAQKKKGVDQQSVGQLPVVLGLQEI